MCRFPRRIVAIPYSYCCQSRSVNAVRTESYVISKGNCISQERAKKKKIIPLFRIEMPFASYLSKQWKHIFTCFFFVGWPWLMFTKVYSHCGFFLFAQQISSSIGCICMTLDNTIRNFENLFVANCKYWVRFIVFVWLMEWKFCFMFPGQQMSSSLCAIFCLSWSMVWV